MKAGRELDQLIAEKVMGQYPTYDDGVWLYYFEEDRRTEVPNYSTDIKAAWAVVEKLAEDRSEPHVIQIYGPLADGYKAEVIWEHHDGPIPVAEAIAETAPLAICLAALKAVSVE